MTMLASSPSDVSNHFIRVRATGQLDARAVDGFERVVREQATRVDGIVLVDVAAVDIADVHALRALDTLQRVVNGSTGSVRLESLSGAREEILRVDRRIRELRAQSFAVAG